MNDTKVKVQAELNASGGARQRDLFDWLSLAVSFLGVLALVFTVWWGLAHNDHKDKEKSNQDVLQAITTLQASVSQNTVLLTSHTTLLTNLGVDVSGLKSEVSGLTSEVKKMGTSVDKLDDRTYELHGRLSGRK